MPCGVGMDVACLIFKQAMSHQLNTLLFCLYNFVPVFLYSILLLQFGPNLSICHSFCFPTFCNFLVMLLAEIYSDGPRFSQSDVLTIYSIALSKPRKQKVVVAVCKSDLNLDTVEDDIHTHIAIKMT